MNNKIFIKQYIITLLLLGGGMGAWAEGWGNVSGSTDVSMIGGTVYGSVFGGGNATEVVGITHVQIGEKK